MRIFEYVAIKICVKSHNDFFRGCSQYFLSIIGDTLLEFLEGSELMSADRYLNRLRKKKSFVDVIGWS